MEDKNKMQSQIRERKDATKETSASDRRLDTFARLLAAESICVAVSVINGKLYISTNELTKDYRTNNAQKNIIDSIDKITKYFKKLAVSSSVLPSNEERKDVFLQICSEKRIKSMALFRNISIPDGLCKSIAQKILENEGELERKDVVYLCSNFGVDPSLVGSIGTELGFLYEDFIKLEKTLIKKDKNKVTDEQLKAFSSGYEIVAPHLRDGVHAEAQILSKIVEEKIFDKSNIYIGVSKLCCLHCHTMIKCSNNVFEEKKLLTSNAYIQVRGWHDLDFDWTAPSLFFKGYSRDFKNDPMKNRNKHEVAYLIGYDTNVSVAPLLELPKPQTNLRSSISGSDKSDSEGEIEESKINQRKVQLEQSLSFMKKRDENSPVKDTIRIISAALALYDIEKFTSLPKFIKNIYPKDEMEENFVAILKSLNENINFKISEKELLEILQDPFLVGDNISKCFKEFNPLEEVKYGNKQEKKDEEEMETMEKSNVEQSVTGEKRKLESQTSNLTISKKQKINPNSNTTSEQEDELKKQAKKEVEKTKKAHASSTPQKELQEEQLKDEQNKNQDKKEKQEQSTDTKKKKKKK